MGAAVMTIPTARPAAFMLARAEAERLTGGAWSGLAGEVVIRGASIDSRAVTPGCLFACLVGERVDGHDFAQTAVGDGAALVLASRALSLPVPVLVVRDVAAALAALAAEFRRRYAPSCAWIGIGGANGKTTTKELLAAACAAQVGEAQVHATRGNLNNHLGVPLTVLAAPVDLRFAIIELGANHPGEVTALAAIAQPQVGVITSIGPEHLEGFGDLAGVCRSECELFAALPPAAPALIGLGGMAGHARDHGLGLDTLLAIVRAAAAGRRLMLIGDHGEVPVQGRILPDGIELRTDLGTTQVPLLGAHNLANAALAFHAAVAAGVDARYALAGLARARPVAGRLVPRRIGAHLLLDDTYNANPASMLAGLEVLAGYPGARLAVLGHMGELGAASAAGHARVGAEAARLGLPLIAVGPLAAGIAAGYRAEGGAECREVASRDEALVLVRQRLAAGPTTVLVKASRSAGLDLLVKSIEAGAAP
jgi:UDP-N-acetylmuramoyl-tripeptide--D-alanyl-D-alanine ligase